MLEDIKAIAELEPSGIIHIAVLFSFSQIVQILLFGGVLLLGRQPLVQKRLFTGQTSKSIQFIFKEISNCFSFICFVFQRTSNVHFWYMHLTLIAAHEYLHAKQKTITCNIRNRDKWEMSERSSCSVHQVPRYIFSWRIWLRYFHSPQSKNIMITLPAETCNYERISNALLKQS